MASNISRVVPLLDRILVKRLSAPSKTKAGILIPEKAKNKVNEGEVLAVGPGGRDSNGNLIPVSVKPGDAVLLPEYGGSQIKTEDEDTEYLIFRDSELIAKLNK